MSSDSSDEENLEFLKEAQDSQFINDSMFSETPEKSAKISSNQNKETLPSLRKTKDDDAQFNFLKVTPEFRNYVARQLSSILDEKLEKQLVNVEVEEIHSETLLRASKSFESNKLDTVEASSVTRPKSRYNRLKVEVSEESLKRSCSFSGRYFKQERSENLVKPE
ncbi:hypothetical protein NQ314_011129 [Rhamnusium bicolor]|uniref:Protein CUSTOS n=1 Tax=Rhamnusium bicolor TaxID=1586634 RepID=A0AAV8XLE0_9CUCU|nr:hypothetical protein NQ314_011129 [Rhamnusium bicolor]